MSYVRHEAIRNLPLEDLVTGLLEDSMPSEQYVAMKGELVKRANKHLHELTEIVQVFAPEEADNAISTLENLVARYAHGS